MRFITPEPIQANWVITLAILGIVVNGLSVLLLYISTARIVSGEYNPFIYFNF